MVRTAKSLAVAKYILQRHKTDGDGALTPMQLIKLVYIAHGFMLGKHGKPLLDEPVEAWQYGPVVPSVYHAVKGYRSSPVDQIPGNTERLKADETELLDWVTDTYGKHNGVVLSAATHRPGTPWHKTWERAGRNSPISNDLIEAFYTDILQQKSHSTL